MTEQQEFNIRKAYDTARKNLVILNRPIPRKVKKDYEDLQTREVERIREMIELMRN